MEQRLIIGRRYLITVLINNGNKLSLLRNMLMRMEYLPREA